MSHTGPRTLVAAADVWISRLRGLARALRWPRASLLAVCVFCVTSVAAQSRYAFDSTPGFLPKHVVPSSYALTLDLDPARDDFSGRAEIAITVRQPVKNIVVHAHQLTPVSLELIEPGKARTLKASADSKTQSWSLVPEDASAIAPGDYTLRIAYRGIVHQTGEGLYRSEYMADGVRARILATQLQARFARTVFPAFDEPSFRATFAISVRAPKPYTVLSNMPLASTAPAANAALYRFQVTPRMPTYLVAVAVGQFDVLQDVAGGVRLSILTAPGKRERARYALEVTKQVLPYYGEYFGIGYVLPKLDQLAVPSTRLGAMEDWGLISYAEDLLVYDPAKSSPNAQRWIYSVIAHEVAHQWFGNLVTAASWDEIWLNEAFATWLAAKATDRFNPEWQIELRRRLSMDWAMQRDAGTATRAIRSGMVSENRVFEVFDEITYNKGGAVLGMLEQWLGEEAFRRGLAGYMKGQSYANATAADLWHHLSSASNKDIAGIASSWTDQAGFPVVALRAQCSEGRTRVSLSQSRFQTQPAGESPQRWKIPVRLARGGKSWTTLLQDGEGLLEIEGCTDEPLVANAGGRGFYRVQYEAAHLAALAAVFERLAPGDRVAILSDTFALAQAGRVPLAAFFDMLAAVPKVADRDRATLFSIARGALDFMDDALAGTAAQARVRAAGRLLFGGELARLGWLPRAGDDSETLKLRSDLISQLANFDDPFVLVEAGRLFDLEASGKQPLPGSIRAAVIRAAGTSADRPRFDQLAKLLRSATLAEDRHTYASALAAGRDAGRADEVLAMSLQGWLPPDVAIQLPSEVAWRSPFKKRAYEFVHQNWDRLAALSGNMFGAKYHLLPNAASGMNERSSADRLLEDQRRSAGEDGVSQAEQTAYRIRLLATFKDREAKSLETVLQTWQPRS